MKLLIFLIFNLVSCVVITEKELELAYQKLQVARAEFHAVNELAPASIRKTSSFVDLSKAATSKLKLDAGSKPVEIHQVSSSGKSQQKSGEWIKKAAEADAAKADAGETAAPPKMSLLGRFLKEAGRHHVDPEGGLYNPNTMPRHPHFR